MFSGSVHHVPMSWLLLELIKEILFTLCLYVNDFYLIHYMYNCQLMVY